MKEIPERIHRHETIPERIHRMLNTMRKPVCDDCITSILALSRRQEVNPVASAFGLTRDFHRYVGHCTHCHDEKKLVTVPR